MDRNRNNVVLSRRVVLEEGRKEERAAILTKLEKGQILPGAVSSIVDFGAFVDLGGIDGLVHISELSWSHVNHPSEVVKVGDKLTVRVLEVDMAALAEGEQDDKKEILSSVNELKEQRTALIDKLNVVVDELSLKLGTGTDGQEHEQGDVLKHCPGPQPAWLRSAGFLPTPAGTG